MASSDLESLCLDAEQRVHPSVHAMPSHGVMGAQALYAAAVLFCDRLGCSYEKILVRVLSSRGRDARPLRFVTASTVATLLEHKGGAWTATRLPFRRWHWNRDSPCYGEAWIVLGERPSPPLKAKKERGKEEYWMEVGTCQATSKTSLGLALKDPWVEIAREQEEKEKIRAEKAKQKAEKEEKKKQSCHVCGQRVLGAFLYKRNPSRWICGACVAQQNATTTDRSAQETRTQDLYVTTTKIQADLQVSTQEGKPPHQSMALWAEPPRLESKGSLASALSQGGLLQRPFEGGLDDRRRERLLRRTGEPHRLIQVVRVTAKHGVGTFQEIGVVAFARSVTVYNGRSSEGGAIQIVLRYLVSSQAATIYIPDGGSFMFQLPAEAKSFGVAMSVNSDQEYKDIYVEQEVFDVFEERT